MCDSTSSNNDDYCNERLAFEITQTRTVNNKNGKHVRYMVQCCRHLDQQLDTNPQFFERRYTDFSQLYNALRREWPELMQNVTFPKKVLYGNFAANLITHRTTGFESLLQRISAESRLTASPAVLHFLQGEVEREDEEEMGRSGRAMMATGQHVAAMPKLEAEFRLLNKVYTDRSPCVILALCRLLGCALAAADDQLLPEAEHWAQLALRRYDAISDADLLQLYVPLLLVCRGLWRVRGHSTHALDDRLEALRRQGVRVDDTAPDLMLAIKQLEEKKNY